jgi:hypothetical protein
VRGLCTKTHEFYLSSLSSTSNFDIIALTETWLNDSVSDGELLDLDSSMFSGKIEIVVDTKEAEGFR